MDSLKTLNRQSNPKQKIQVGDTTTADFKTYYKAVVIKTALCWPSNWHKDWCDRMETSEIIHIYTADRFLIKKILKPYSGARTLSSSKGWQNWMQICSRMKLHLHLWMDQSLLWKTWDYEVTENTEKVYCYKREFLG